MVRAFLLALLLASTQGVTPHVRRPRRPAIAPRPYRLGERLEYNAKVNFLHVGSGTMTVEGLDTVRGHVTFHTVFNVHGRMLFFGVDDHYASWIDTLTHGSLRYVQRIHEGGYRKQRDYEFFPERATFSDDETPGEQPSVPYALDDASFIYYVRTMDLEVGKSYELNRYFDPRANPVRIDVVRREHVEVPAGEFDAIVLRPTIKTKGLFSEGGHAEIWLADDSTRAVLKLTSGLPFGTLVLELKEIGTSAERTEAR